MRFVDSAERRALILDNNVGGLFSSAKNNDYIFYYEDDGGWIETPVVRGNFLTGKRYKAIRRASVIECETVENSLSLADHTPILDGSPVTVSYQLNNLNRSGLLSMSRDALDRRILSMVLDVLRAPVSRRTFQQLADQQYEILAQANTRLSDQVQHGFSLRIETMNLRTAMSSAVGDETMKHYRHAQTLIRRVNEDLVSLDLRQRHQLSDLMVDKLRNTQKVSLIHELMQLSPQYLQMAVAMLDPNAARILLSHAQAQAQTSVNGAAMAGLLAILAQHLQHSPPAGQLPGWPQQPPQPGPQWPQQPGPQWPQQPGPQWPQQPGQWPQQPGPQWPQQPQFAPPAVDPACQPYLALGYSTCTRFGNEIRLTYGPLRVTLTTDGQRVRSVMWGENDPPTNRWTGALNPHPEAMARLVLEWLRQNF
jgi:hypothetical protein